MVFQLHFPKIFVLPQLLFHDFNESDKKMLMRLSTIIITSTLILYVAAQFQAAGTTFATILGISQNASVILGALVILIYTFIGGFWAVSLTDSIQAVLMFCIAIFLPLLLLMVAGGFSGVNIALEAIGTPQENSLTGVYAGMLGIGFIIGNIMRVPFFESAKNEMRIRYATRGREPPFCDSNTFGHPFGTGKQMVS